MSYYFMNNKLSETKIISKCDTITATKFQASDCFAVKNIPGL